MTRSVTLLNLNVVMVWDVLSDILRAEQGEGKKVESNREEEFLLWQCYRENGLARGGP